MKSISLKRIFAGVLGAATLCTAIPFSGVSAEEASVEIVYSADFEDGTNDFDGRKGFGTALIEDQGANGSSKCMRFTSREKSWHGPQILLDGICEPGVEYIVSAYVKTPWYANVTLSTECTDESGVEHYANKVSAVSQGDWVKLEPTKFTLSSEMTKNYIYFECSDTNVDISIDDFVITTAPAYQIQKDIVSLKQAYADKFKIGTAVTTEELAPKSTKDLIAKHFNSITLGNELKPDAVLDKNACLAMAQSGDDTDPQVNIASARTLLNYCRDNNIPVRGHVLVWHSQTPDWFFKENYDDNADWVTEEKMLKRMENYIKNVFAALEKEYPDVDFYAWDVVNEAWGVNDGNPRKPGGQGSNGSDNSAWVQVFGDNSFIEPAFKFARLYAPEGTKLYYNDFNEYMPDKTNAIYNMAMNLKEKNLIDGIGMQSHLDVGFPSVSQYEKALEKFASTGLDIQITELDITTSDTSEAGFKKQAEMYKGIMDACVKYSDSISAVVFWGTTDDKSWRASRCPLLFNEDYTAKESFYAITEGFEPPEPILGDVDRNGTVTLEDLVEMISRLSKLSSGELDHEVADMNSDEVVNVYDAVILKRIIMKG